MVAPRTCAALLAVLALIGMARLAPSSAAFELHDAPAVRSVIGAARQPEAIVERSMDTLRIAVAQLDAAVVPAASRLAVSLWAVLALVGISRAFRGRAPVVLRPRGPPAFSS
jgi:hypothetical protein